MEVLHNIVRILVGFWMTRFGCCVLVYLVLSFHTVSVYHRVKGRLIICRPHPPFV